MDCCDASGGRTILTVGNKRYQTRGGIRVMPTVFEKEANANDDGSLYVTTKPMPAMAEFTLSDKCGLNINDLVEGCFVDATFDFIDMKKKWLFSRASIVGRPEFSSESGEISGLKIASSFVQMIEY